jgi:cytochrome b6-f complex iron-sulfur subunit
MAGTLAFPIGKFIFFTQDQNQEFWISLKNIDEGITKIDKHNVFVYKNQDKLEVFNAHCTHMGCIINFHKDKNRFICPCHHSQFTIDGLRIKGPAQRDLDKITFKIKNKKLFIG